MSDGSLIPFHNNTIQANATLNWFQEYKSRLTMQSLLADCFEGQIITCIVVIIFVAVFLLREWIVQNIPMEAPMMEDDDELILDHQPQPIPDIPQQQPQHDERFDSLFDVRWNADDNEPHWHEERPPPSPVASNTRYDEAEGSSSNPDKTENDNRRMRATSLPPSFSRTSSYHEPMNSEHTEFRRSASMEPSSSSSSYDNEPMNSTFIVQQNFTYLGQPPHAPRMRHAEAPIAIQPIQEEIEQEIAPLPQPLPQLQPVENNNNDNEDEEEDNIEEFEGVLEAIGMQGSLWSLLQNCALMGLLIALSLGAAVWMPYLIGMLFIMTETWEVVRVPLKMVRLLTDPLIDFIFWVSTDYIGPYILQVYNDHIQPVVQDLTSSFLYKHVSTSLGSLFDLVAAPTSNTSMPITQNMQPSFMDAFVKFINETEPMVESALRRYQALAIRQTAVDRFACIAVGYIIVTIVSCWYLTRSAQHRVATAALGRTAQEAIRHQGIIFKVGMFITIELVLFPIVCGYLLDFSTLPLFESTAVAIHWEFMLSHPVSSIFVHWFLGTGFMFIFAVLATICREVLRPGVMWFIRDPNNPQFHPIREIIERPVLFQLRKIGASALIYLAVILVGVGGVLQALKWMTGQAVLPLRWNFSNPISVVPLDIIVLQTGIPAIVKYFEPKQVLKQLFVKWIKLICHQLRLSSFMFGRRRADEEGALVYHNWIAWLKHTKPACYPPDGEIDNIISNDVSYIWEGRLLRVPRHDSVPIIERRRMLVPVDPITLLPLDETERHLGHPAASAPGGEEANTMIVYSPPHFKQRIFAFMGLTWLSISIFCCIMIVGPTLLGRALFGSILGNEIIVHDIYSFLLGGSVFLFVGVICHQLQSTIKDIMYQLTWQTTLTTFWHHAKQWSSWIFRWLFFVVSFGIILPNALGVLIELYFVLPLKQISQDDYSIEVLSIWSNGFALMTLLCGIVLNIPNANRRQFVDDIFRGGIHNMNIRLCLVRMIGPFLLFTAVAVGFPFITAYINMKIIARINPELRIKLVQIAYPIALVGFGGYYLTRTVSRVSARLAQNIREDNYLVGRTLHNLE
ncbi:uncharacterized protein B0P05DRAFT_584861 [Gilbertella persicaria]|uniref:uncharacterized protein n=1 Tax=Gilbertella persicaria TaxID=101096 RepID=UPI00222116AE|nr:uncharacterized protein B0P05DRAFT_584861 [Gilbertella persicaria]KAI8087629.1 hypothetical protein B0P05DRAFT_584861 [Gilbertella persicaria]